MAAPASTYEQALRIHDIAFMRWLLGCRIDYGNIAGTPRRDEPILALMSSPEHAFAQVPDLLVERNWISGATAAEMRAEAEENYSVLPLPVAAVESGDPEVQTEIANVPMRNTSFDFDPETGQFISHPHPAFYNVNYTITLMGLTRSTWAHIFQWIAGELGKLGRADTETLIPVEHTFPWGTLNQRLRYQGVSDLSVYEGNEEPRYIRKQITFDLRMLVMKRLDIDGGDGRAYDIDRITFCPTDASDQTDTELEQYRASGYQYDQLSMNLFHIPELNGVWDVWPRGGDATVEPLGKIYPVEERLPNSLVVTGETPVTDWVEIGEIRQYPYTPPTGYVLSDVSFEYDSTGDWLLEVYSRDLSNDTLELMDTLLLPEASRHNGKRVHLFSPVDKDSVCYRLTPASAGEREIRLANIAIHRISMSQNFAPTNIIDTGTEWRYEWEAIGVKKPYLVLAQIASTSGGVKTATVDDALSSPDFSKSRDIQDGDNKWIAFLIQPKVNDLVLRVPNDVTLATTRIVRYHGDYRGHTV